MMGRRDVHADFVVKPEGLKYRVRQWIGQFCNTVFFCFGNTGVDGTLAILLPNLKRFSCNGAVDWSTTCFCCESVLQKRWQFCDRSAYTREYCGSERGHWKKSTPFCASPLCVTWAIWNLKSSKLQHPTQFRSWNMKFSKKSHEFLWRCFKE